MATTDRVAAIVAPLADERGLDLYDVEQHQASVRVLVDREGGVDIDTLAELSRAVSRALDEVDPVAGKYTLEVSSPGLERPLRRPDHFAGAVGEQVSVKTVPGTEGDRRVTGALNLQHFGLLALGGLGLALTVRDRRTWPLAAWFFFNTVVINLLFFPEPRFRLPTMPVVMVWAGAAVSHLAARTGGRRRGPPG